MYFFHLAYDSILRIENLCFSNVAIYGYGLLGKCVHSLLTFHNINCSVFSKRKFKNNKKINHIKNYDQYSFQDDKSSKTYDSVILTSNKWDYFYSSLNCLKITGQLICLSFLKEWKIKFNPLDAKFFYSKNLKILQIGNYENLFSSEDTATLSLSKNLKSISKLLLKNSKITNYLSIFEKPYTELSKCYLSLSKKRSCDTYLINWKI